MTSVPRSSGIVPGDGARISFTAVDFPRSSRYVLAMADSPPFNPYSPRSLPSTECSSMTLTGVRENGCNELGLTGPVEDMLC